MVSAKERLSKLSDSEFLLHIASIFPNSALGNRAKEVGERLKNSFPGEPNSGARKGLGMADDVMDDQI